MTRDIKISLISDTHLLPVEMIADNEPYRQALAADRKLMTESEGLLDKAIDMIEQRGSKVLLVSGDLTKDGEVISHRVFKEKMEGFVERNPGSRVFLIPGNHDINNRKSKNFNVDGQGKVENTPSITPGQFIENYGQLVFNDAISMYRDSEHFKAYLEEVNKEFDREEKYKYYAHGYTSYAARLDLDENTPGSRGLTIIGLDTIKYSIDKVMEREDGCQNTEGAVTINQMKWLVDVCEEANKRQDAILLLAHQAFIPHFYRQEKTLGPYIIDDWDKPYEDEDVRINGKTPIDILANMGIRYMFTGHMHGQDIAKHTSTQDKKIYDIETGSIVTYPLPIRHMTLINRLDETEPRVDLDIKTKQIKSFDYKLSDGTSHSVSDAVSYATNELITPELIEGMFRNYVLPHIELGSRDFLLKFLDKDEVEKHGLGSALMNKIEKAMGTRKNPGVHKKLGIGNAYAYVHDIENSKEYGSGKDIIIDIKFLGMTFGYALPEKNLTLLVQDIFEQLDKKILEKDEMIIDAVYDLSKEFLDSKVADRGSIITLSDLVNVAYLTFLAGDEKQSEDLKAIISKYRNVNLLKQALNGLSGNVAGKLDYITKNVVYNRSIESYIYRYTKNNKTLAKIVDKKFYDIFGYALIDTLLSFNLSSKEVVSKLLALEKVDVILNPLNNLVIDMAHNLTSEDQERYQHYAYKEDNTTYLSELL